MIVCTFGRTSLGQSLLECKLCCAKALDLSRRCINTTSQPHCNFVVFINNINNSTERYCSVVKATLSSKVPCSNFGSDNDIISIVVFLTPPYEFWQTHQNRSRILSFTSIQHITHAVENNNFAKQVSFNPYCEGLQEPHLLQQTVLYIVILWQQNRAILSYKYQSSVTFRLSCSCIQRITNNELTPVSVTSKCGVPASPVLTDPDLINTV
jgi:hypothetical protein